MQSQRPGHLQVQGKIYGVNERVSHLNARLVAALEALGVYFLRGADASAPTKHIAPNRLLAGLAASDEARVRLALIPLLLHRPDFAAYANADAALDPEAQVVLMCYYTAALYLQRKYRLRLEKLMGCYDPLPDLFSKALGLRPCTNPDDGLQALAQRHAILSGKPINWLGTYEHAAQRWLTSMERR
jgi:hypothetical protein